MSQIRLDQINSSDLAAYSAATSQPVDATLTALAALTIAANSLTVGTGADAFTQTAFAANTFPARASSGNLVAKAITDFGLSLVDDADAAAARTTLGLGTAATHATGDYDAAGAAAAAQAASQPLDSDLTAIAALSTTSFGRGGLTQADAAAFRTYIGAGTGSGSGDALTSNPLSQFAATTSAQLAGVISDKTGSGALVFAVSPALTGTPTAPTAGAGTSTTQLATTAFVASAVTTAVTGLLNFKGSTDCSGTPNYPSAVKGDSYVVSVAGKIGGASGTSVDVGDWYIAEADNAGGTEAGVGSSWGHMEHNLVGALLASNNLSDVANGDSAITNLGGAAYTGTGGLVRATSPTLVTPALGTPSSGNLANCTFPTLNQNTSGSAASCTGNAATATALATGRTLAITGDLAWTSPTFDGSGNVTAAGTLATVATAGTTGSSTAIPVITINVKGLVTSITTAAVVAPAGTLTGATLAGNVLASSLTSVGTLTGGATGAGFTIALSTSTLTGTLPVANLPATITQAETITLTDAATATQSTVLTLGHNSSGSVVNGFGSKVLWLLQDTTTADQNAADLLVAWQVSTHASRRSLATFRVYDASGAVECWSCLAGLSSQAQIGFLNAPPVARQTGDAGTALALFGLMLGTPTFACANLTGTTLPSSITASSLTSFGTAPTLSGQVRMDCHYGAVTTDTDGATITFDCSATDKHRVTLGGNRTLAVSNDQTGQGFLLRIDQPASGGPYTVTWWSGIKWPGGVVPTLTTTASKYDLFSFVKWGSGDYTGTSLLNL